MKKYFSIGDAAKAAHMTRETLRHYDRIGLVKPSRIDEWSKYRYYTKQDIVKLNTIQALQQMDLSLQEIKNVLEYDKLEKIIDFLEQAEKKAEKKIAELQYSKAKIQLAKADYEKKLCAQQNRADFSIKSFPQRVIMLSETMEKPTLDNLWNYLSHFYENIEPSARELYSFEDLAGIYTEAGESRLFAVCIRYPDRSGLKILPKGRYLCAGCAEENRQQVLHDVMKAAREQYNVVPAFTVQLIVVSGILQWDYQIQLYLGEDEGTV